VPAVLYGGAALTVCRFALTPERHAQIRDALHRRTGEAAAGDIPAPVLVSEGGMGVPLPLPD